MRVRIWAGEARRIGEEKRIVKDQRLSRWRKRVEAWVMQLGSLSQ